MIYDWKKLLEESERDEVFPFKSMEFHYPIFNHDPDIPFTTTSENEEVMQQYYDKLVQAGFIIEEIEEQF